MFFLRHQVTVGPQGFGWGSSGLGRRSGNRMTLAQPRKDSVDQTCRGLTHKVGCKLKETFMDPLTHCKTDVLGKLLKIWKWAKEIISILPIKCWGVFP